MKSDLSRKAPEMKVGSELRVAAAAFAFIWVLGDPVLASTSIAPFLAAYAAFGIFAAVLAHREEAAYSLRAACWVDLACFTALFALAGQMHGFLLVLLAVPICIASLQSGFARASKVAGIAALVLVGLLFLDVLGLIHAAVTADIVPAAGALSAGLLFARWAEIGRRRARELAVENELLTAICIPQPIEALGRKVGQALRQYCHAEVCFVFIATGADGYVTRVAGEGAAGAADGLKDEGQDEVRDLLKSMPPQRIYVHGAGGPGGAATSKAWEGPEMNPVSQADESGGRLARILGADSLLSLPMATKESVVGRVVVASRALHLSAADAKFLMQLLARAAMVVAAACLAERSAAEAARAARRKISHDLHDSTLQPYIGLKLGLEALQRRILPDDPIAAEVEELTSMVTESIEELREYVGDLKAPRPKQEPASLLRAVNREAEKFMRHHGIAVTVNAQDDMSVGASMEKEVRHLVREALSNIRRHTPSEHAVIGLRRENRRLVMEFVNDDSVPAAGSSSFFPKSLAERARDLGGRVHVDKERKGRTAVKVEVPV